MNSDSILAQIRKFLFIISLAVFGMTMTELVFLGHWNKPIQFLPFVLCAFGLITSACAYFYPGRISLACMRWSMVMIGLCSLIGVFEHITGNYRFWLEMQPGAATWALIKAALEGENPVLAPGILFLGAAIGLSAIYRYPLSVDHENLA